MPLHPLDVESGTRIETKGEDSMAIYLQPKSCQEKSIPVESIKLDMIVVNINGLDIKAGETLQLFSKEISQEELQKADLRSDNDLTQYNNGYVLTAAPRSNALSLGTKANRAAT